MKIRNATMNDLPRMEEIFAYAREQMKKNGNPTQWGDNRPTRETLLKYIEAEKSYVIEDEDGIYGTFVFFIGDDPTYHIIEEGKWINEDPYGVIHCVASDGSRKGILRQIIQYAQEQTGNLRIDTHRNNHIMQHLLIKEGFKQCGIIYTDDGTERLAYQWIR